VRVFAAVLPMLFASGAARAAEPATGELWSVEVVADGRLGQGDVERAASGLRGGLRAAGKVLVPEGGAAAIHLVAHLSETSETPQEFGLRLDGAGGEAVAGPKVLLEDGARQLAVHRASPNGRIVVPGDIKAEWFVDGHKVAPEAGTALVVSRGTYVVSASTAAGTVARVMVQVGGGERVPFPRLVPGSLAISGLAGPELAVARPAPAPVTATSTKIPWLWIGVAAGAVALAGAAAALADRPGSSSTTTVVPGGPGTTTVTVKQ
jgi:hypothetical protein